MLQPHTRKNVVPVSWCPSCGNQTLGTRHTDVDYWYTLAEACGINQTERGVELVKRLYDMWEPSIDSNFVDWAKGVLREHERTA